MRDNKCYMYNYGCLHRPWLNEHGRTLKDHGRAWIEIQMTKSDQSCPGEMVQSSRDHVHHFQCDFWMPILAHVCLTTHNELREIQSGPDVSSSYFRKSIVL